MNKKVEALHDFHNAEYAQEWADRFVPTPPRQELFTTIIDQLQLHSLPNKHVVELGIGPGYLALEVLQRIADITYEGVDFSAAMFKIADSRLENYRGQVTYTQIDLTEDDWHKKLSKIPDAIITTWALHDLGSEQNILSVYQHAKKVLPEGGLLLNGDFIKPEKTEFEYEAGRITIQRHIDLLKQAGFQEPECLVYLEADTEKPTTANNYACLRGRV